MRACTYTSHKVNETNDGLKNQKPIEGDGRGYVVLVQKGNCKIMYKAFLKIFLHRVRPQKFVTLK